MRDIGKILNSAGSEAGSNALLKALLKVKYEYFPYYHFILTGLERKTFVTSSKYMLEGLALLPGGYKKIAKDIKQHLKYWIDWITTRLQPDKQLFEVQDNKLRYSFEQDKSDPSNPLSYNLDLNHFTKESPTPETVPVRPENQPEPNFNFAERLHTVEEEIKKAQEEPAAAEPAAAILHKPAESADVANALLILSQGPGPNKFLNQEPPGTKLNKRPFTTMLDNNVPEPPADQGSPKRARTA